MRDDVYQIFLIMHWLTEQGVLCREELLANFTSPHSLP